MKVFSYLAAAATMVAVSQAFVVTLYNGENCSGDTASRNVYDNTCAETGGFQSYKITTYGGSGQKLITWSRNACAGPQTSKRCAQGKYKAPLNECFNSVDGSGGSNAISSISSLGDCPN